MLCACEVEGAIGGQQSGDAWCVQAKHDCVGSAMPPCCPYKIGASWMQWYVMLLPVVVSIDEFEDRGFCEGLPHKILQNMQCQLRHHLGVSCWICVMYDISTHTTNQGSSLGT